MKKKKLYGLSVLAVACSVLFLLAACAKKTVVSSTPSTDVFATEEAGRTETPTDLEEEVRQQRIEDLTSPDQGMDKIGPDDIFSQKIYFDYDRSDLSTEARTTLKKIAAALQSNPSCSIDISGHCDERGTIEYNIALGESRARSAQKVLMTLGISADRMTTISYGEERPVDTRSTEEAWAKNRRDEFTLIK